MIHYRSIVADGALFHTNFVVFSIRICYNIRN